MGFHHLYGPRISALSKNLRNEKRLLIELEEQIDRFEDDPRSKDWRTVSTLKGKESRYCTHGSTTVSSTEKSLHFWTSLSRKAISLRARWRRLGTDGAPLGDVTFPPFLPIKVKDAVAIPLVTTPDTHGRASHRGKNSTHLDRMKAHLMDAQNSRSRIFISGHLGLGKRMTNRCHGKKDYRIL